MEESMNIMIECVLVRSCPAEHCLLKKRVSSKVDRKFFSNSNSPQSDLESLENCVCSRPDESKLLKVTALWLDFGKFWRHIIQIFAFFIWIYSMLFNYLRVDWLCYETNAKVEQAKKKYSSDQNYNAYHLCSQAKKQSQAIFLVHTLSTEIKIQSFHLVSRVALSYSKRRQQANSQLLLSASASFFVQSPPAL